MKENIITGIIFFLTVLILISSIFSLASDFISVSKSKYLIRVSGSKYYTDNYEKTENSVLFTDVKTNQHIIIYFNDNIIIEERN